MIAPDKRWAVVCDPTSGNHVIPVADLIGHQESELCGCLPRIEDGVYIHNSFDGREITERAIDMARKERN